MKKKIVIIIPGAKFIKSKNKFMQFIILSFYSLTNVMHPIYINYAGGWKEFFARKNSHVIWLHWSRGISLFSKWIAIRKLKRLIKHYKNYDIVVVGMSLGGEIALEVAEKFPNKIKKIILVGSANEKSVFNTGNTKIINLYSKKDKFQEFAVKALSPIFGSVQLRGPNVKNINLPGITHDKFFANTKIKYGKYKGKNISETIENFIKN